MKAVPCQTIGVEVELLAPLGSDRRQLAEAIAARVNGTVTSYFHIDSEPSKVTGKPISYAFQLSHQTAATIRVVLAATLLNILLNSLLIPLAGTLGAALSTLAAYMICVVYGFEVGRKYFPLLINWPALCQIVLSALLMFGILELLPLQPGWLAGVLRMLIGIAVYTSLVLLFDIAGIRGLVFSHCKRMLVNSHQI